MKKIFAIAPIMFLAACETVMLPTSAPISPLPTQDTCNAAQYSGLIGQDATALERVMILGQVRVIRPNTAVTMDFRPERINFNVDGANRIASISCN